MNLDTLQTDKAVLKEMGTRLSGVRLSRNWTQEDLADNAGVGKSTVERIEKGVSSQTVNLVKIFRTLDLLPSLLDILPKNSPTPLDLLKLKGNGRKRATKKHRAPGTPSCVAEKSSWVWGEDK